MSRLLTTACYYVETGRGRRHARRSRTRAHRGRNCSVEKNEKTPPTYRRSPAATFIGLGLVLGPVRAAPSPHNARAKTRSKRGERLKPQRHSAGLRDASCLAGDHKPPFGCAAAGHWAGPRALLRPRKRAKLLYKQQTVLLVSIFPPFCSNCSPKHSMNAGRRPVLSKKAQDR